MSPSPSRSAGERWTVRPVDHVRDDPARPRGPVTGGVLVPGDGVVVDRGRRARPRRRHRRRRRPRRRLRPPSPVVEIVRTVQAVPFSVGFSYQAMRVVVVRRQTRTSRSPSPSTSAATPRSAPTRRSRSCAASRRSRRRRCSRTRRAVSLTPGRGRTSRSPSPSTSAARHRAHVGERGRDRAADPGEPVAGRVLVPRDRRPTRRAAESTSRSPSPSRSAAIDGERRRFASRSCCGDQALPSPGDVLVPGDEAVDDRTPTRTSGSPSPSTSAVRAVDRDRRRRSRSVRKPGSSRRGHVLVPARPRRRRTRRTAGRGRRRRRGPPRRTTAAQVA